MLLRVRVQVTQLKLPSVEGAAQIANASLDFVYIDGDHTYAGVKADILAWRPKLKPGAVIGGDDFDLPDVIRAGGAGQGGEGRGGEGPPPQQWRVWSGAQS